MASHWEACDRTRTPRHTPNVSEDEADHDQLYSSSDDDSGDDTNDFLN